VGVDLRHVEARRGNPFQVADLSLDGQRLLKEPSGPRGVTQPYVGDSQIAQGAAFAVEVPDSPCDAQCLLQEKPKSCQVNLEGTLKPGVTAKDVILALIAKIGVGGGTGHVFEYTGSAVRSMSMEERMTLCNMSIEGGARAGLVAPDEITYEYLARRKFVPRGSAWEEALQSWQSLPSDEGAVYDKTVHMEVSTLEPRITYGTNPGMGIPITGKVPIPGTFTHPDERALVEKALLYMGLTPGQAISGHPLDAVFIGSCTNGRISDLRQASQIMKGRKIAPGLRVLVVPGSNQVKLQAEAEGLDKIFKAAGAEWREPGCSLCLGMNGDILQPGQSAVSTSNRNFEGRQGKGARTFLASPYTAAASAIAGSIADPRPILTEMANR